MAKIQHQIIDQCIDVYLSITGWTCVHRILKNWEGDGEYWDNWNTGIGKYKTRELALVEARAWGQAEEIRVNE